MKQMEIPKMVALIGACAIAILCAHAQTSTTSVATLEPIAFLTAHEWDAQLPDSPEGKKKKIHAAFTWTQNRQAIRISNELVTDGKASPYHRRASFMGSAAARHRLLVRGRKRKSHERHGENGRWKTGPPIPGDGVGWKDSGLRGASNAAWK